jgi:hypothetical protein
MSKANEPAFPLPTGNESIHPSCAGLTKREYFSALLLQGLVQKPLELEEEAGRRTIYGHYAFAAVASADALIAELNRAEERS